ncbi:modular type i polyketide [Lasius niger]|uniref:Modular type i polyketide n=1 Tax=Lasius niger TaxID=67767 RepID=A0A0J7P645_LASNI|nr:modular type i polyketide [Lasius niger]
MRGEIDREKKEESRRHIRAGGSEKKRKNGERGRARCARRGKGERVEKLVEKPEIEERMPRAPPNQHLSSVSTFPSTYSTLDNSTCCVLEMRSETRDVACAFVNSIVCLDNARLRT